MVNLFFQGVSVIRSQPQRSQKRRSTRQIAFRLCDSRLQHKSICVVGCDIENLLKVCQRFWETTKTDVGTRVLRKKAHIAWVKLLSFLEIGVALFPAASPPFDIGERLRYSAVIGQELVRLLEVGHSGVVVFKAGVMIKTFREHSLAKLRL